MQKAHYNFLESPKQYFCETYIRELKNTQTIQMFLRFCGSFMAVPPCPEAAIKESTVHIHIVKIFLPTPKTQAQDTFKVVVYMMQECILSFTTSALSFWKSPTVAFFLWILFCFQWRNCLLLHINTWTIIDDPGIQTIIEKHNSLIWST